ncbi:MAG TPA: SDR family NAD(P)-dependent oxidoreductase [Gammaproteobacteria bacterium]|jgi:NAD(P)-dependent dehydrogenase (short-subunit alcohol dehydrogenase family)|nr:SDR family NAD(P)-dependent oxidoreductase [Gammaproteobacteria bacterium]
MDRRQFMGHGALLALAAYAGRAGAQDVPRSSFAAGATAEEVTAGIDLAGKTIVVTGCNSGIGLETMRVLALRGAHVIGTARTLERGREACAGVQGKATPVVLELSDFDSVVACANEIRALNVPVDALVCNAGVLLTELEQVRGLEMQFVVNHLGHFIFVSRLLERVTAAPQGRVVVVGSIAHRQVPPGGIQFDNLSGRGWERQAYGHSKLANGLFSLELSKRLAGTRATSNSLHPGVVATNIMRNTNFRGGGMNWETPAQGAATSCYLASNPKLARVTGQYFADCNPAEQSDYQKDPAMAAKLWKVSEDLTRPYLA